MKGYKGTDANMCCHGFQYEIGKTHEVKGKLQICLNGFHFCEKLIAIDDCYDLSTSRVFEVEATGDIQEGKLKFCTNEIKFIRELSKDEIVKLANEAVNDTDMYVRETLAKLKFASNETLEILSKDSGWNVRQAVAKNLNTDEKALKFLSHDEHYCVRTEVASNPNTSKEVLKHLSQDDDWYVRRAVAKNLNTTNIVLKIMCHDKDSMVQMTAKKTLEMK
ncbi:MAG: HEAT repeat domain-containing protein [Erysipelotrichaceae bacterium]